MAKVTGKTEQVTSVILELDREEAEFIAVILANVGGDDKISGRRHEPPIAKALRKAGIAWEKSKLREKRTGSIHFGVDQQTYANCDTCI